jgi:hypothetical protein
MRAWYRRATALHGELAALAELRDPRWWLIAGGAALPWDARPGYVASDGEPAADTFIGHAVPPRDPIALARAARTALRELDAALPDQPLAVTVRRTPAGARIEPSALDVAAFAIGDACWCGSLDDPALPSALTAAVRGEPHASLRPPGTGPVPFVCVTLGDEPLATARHAHRRAWTASGGPWLGITRSADLQLVTTCHLIVDGYGHARLAARINDLSGDVFASFSCADFSHEKDAKTSPVKDAISLNVVWRPVAGQLRAIPLAYQLGIELHRLGKPSARFSPTIQVPVAPGAPNDPMRVRRRVVPAIVSVRFDDGRPEPFEMFAARARGALAREASGDGLASSLLAAARATPAPLAWKRRALGPGRPRWLEPVADLIGGRGCVSRIKLDVPSPPACAASSPARLVEDEIGACVLTVVDDGERAAITLAGIGNAADKDLLDRVLFVHTRMR